MGFDSNDKSQSQEIDLNYLSKKAFSLFDYVGYLVFLFFRFLLKNAIVIIVLIVSGAIIGYFLDRNSDNLYKHEIIVVPNFGSNSYLYNTLKNLELGNTPIKSIEIEPILDVYQFIKEDWANLEIAKYLSENNIQFAKYEPESDVEKMYRYHLMTVVTSKRDDGGKIVDSLLNELNKDSYFLDRQKIEQENTKVLILGLQRNLESIDQILTKIGTPGTNSDLNIEMYSEINNLINSKKPTAMDLNKFKIYQLEQTKVIYPASKMLNIKEGKIRKMILLPVLLVGIYLMGCIVLNFFKKYSREHSQKKIHRV